MLVVPGATTCLTTLLWRCRSKTSRTRPAPKKPNPKIRSQPHHVTMQQSHLRRTTGRIRRRGSRVKGENTLGSRKSRLRPLTSTPLMSQRKRRRSMTLVRSRVSIVIRKVILPATTSSQKTSIGLDNLRAGDWWWWAGCQGALHLIPGLIPRKTGKNFAR